MKKLVRTTIFPLMLIGGIFPSFGQDTSSLDVVDTVLCTPVSKEDPLEIGPDVTARYIDCNATGRAYPAKDGSGNYVGTLSNLRIGIIEQTNGPRITTRYVMQYDFYNGSGGTWGGSQYLVLTPLTSTGAVVEKSAIQKGIIRGRCWYGGAGHDHDEGPMAYNNIDIISSFKVEITRVSGEQNPC